MSTPATESVDNLPTCAEVGHCTGRRAVLRGAAALGAVGVLAACGGGGSSDVAEPPAAGTEPATGGTAPSTGGTEPAPAGSAGGTELGPTSDVPVGGGKIYKAQKIVVTQPTAGEYKAFTAVCTHEQCIVGEVADGSITCFCHLSKFSAADGSVQSGLASAPLEKKSINVAGGKITLA
ncbi:MAG: Rieske 2Fe-2S domain-containing protein [Sporichthyaceae bacterium]